MKQLSPILMLLTLMLNSPTVRAQFLSPYLEDPDLAIGYVDSCASFWLNSYDDDLGGFYTNVNRQGEVVTSWGTNKNTLTQSRNAYGMARAYQLTGNEDYLDYMEGALAFQYEHAWDGNYGGWFEQLSENGSVIGQTNNRQAFFQHYGLLGPTVAWEVTRGAGHWNIIEAGWDHLETHWWDSREDHLGYYDDGSYGNTNFWGKSFNATVDAMTTHLITLMLNTDDPQYRERYQQVAHQVRDHLVASMPDQAIGFVEHYTSNWAWDTGETMTIMGHVLKSGWCLAREEQVVAQDASIPDARALVDDVLALGYDHELGGPYKDYNRVTGEMLMWGNPDTAKAWWQMEQAVTAGLQLFDVTGDSSYLQMADETLHFFMRFFVDHLYGEVYENRTRYGAETWGTTKGNGYKGAYHSIELGYYTYLYGNLFLHSNPVTLHYYFEPADTARSVHLTPLAIGSDELVIGAVLHEGTAYPHYSYYPRTIDLAAGTGGHFTVTFERVAPGIVAYDQILAPESSRLGANYPNPFNAQTTIQISGILSGSAEIEIFNLQGQVVRTLSAESGKTIWDAKSDIGEDLPSGIYMYRLADANDLTTWRMLLLR